MFWFGLDILGRVLLVMLRNLVFLFMHAELIARPLSRKPFPSGHVSGTREVWCPFTLWSMIPFPRQPGIILLYIVLNWYQSAWGCLWYRFPGLNAFDVGDNSCDSLVMIVHVGFSSLFWRVFQFFTIKCFVETLVSLLCDVVVRWYTLLWNRKFVIFCHNDSEVCVWGSCFSKKKEFVLVKAISLNPQ